MQWLGHQGRKLLYSLWPCTKKLELILQGASGHQNTENKNRKEFQNPTDSYVPHLPVIVLVSVQVHGDASYQSVRGLRGQLLGTGGRIAAGVSWAHYTQSEVPFQAVWGLWCTSLDWAVRVQPVCAVSLKTVSSSWLDLVCKTTSFATNEVFSDLLWQMMGGCSAIPEMRVAMPLCI